MVNKPLWQPTVCLPDIEAPLSQTGAEARPVQRGKSSITAILEGPNSPTPSSPIQENQHVLFLPHQHVLEETGGRDE